MASHDSSEVRFADSVAALVGVIGHADRATPLRDYCTGLLMPAERKSVEPMAAVTGHGDDPRQNLIQGPLMAFSCADLAVGAGWEHEGQRRGRRAETRT